jgi:predicted anti-sigma-YlaC factor YlaD
MLNCREVTERASDYLDRTLPLWQSVSVHLHLLMCQYCRRYVRQLRTLLVALRQMAEIEVPEEMICRQVEALLRDA